MYVLPFHLTIVSSMFLFSFFNFILSSWFYLFSFKNYHSTILLNIKVLGIICVCSIFIQSTLHIFNLLIIIFVYCIQSVFFNSTFSLSRNCCSFKNRIFLEMLLICNVVNVLASVARILRKLFHPQPITEVHTQILFYFIFLVVDVICGSVCDNCLVDFC